MNKVGHGNEPETYNGYLAEELELFRADPGRQQALLKAVESIRVERVLDLGCGAGQEMLPFVSRGALGFGIDVTPEVGRVGRKMFSQEGYSERVNFVRATGTRIPFASESFDVLICRVALMYMDNKTALCEMSRVLRPGSRFFLKYHAPSYYWSKFGDGLRQAYFKSSIHAARVLYAGYFYHLSGRQPEGRLTAGGEVFQTKELLGRELERVGMRIIGEMPDSNNQTPSLIITKY